MVDQRAHIRSPLFVTDIFYVILDYFYPGFDSTDKQTLVSLASTCHTLSEPSLDRLWRTLSSLEPLIRCYTSDVQNLIPPTSSQFAIINRYSHRVRELTVSGSPSMRFLQCMSMQTSYLFPNLIVLVWSPYHRPPSHIPIIFIRQLLVQSLVSLKANLTESDGATLLSFFDSYPVLCPNLKSVEFQLPAESASATTIQALSRAICRQYNLENVEIYAPINDVALRHLATLPTLKVLTARLSEKLRPQIRSFLPTDPLFRNVGELVFKTSNIDLVTNLLRPRDQIFHTFSLYYNNRLTSTAALTLLNLLTSRPRTRPFRDLMINAGDFSHPLRADQMESEAPRYRLSYKILQPLMVFGLLHTLMIVWSEQISLDDNELANLARSWPLLESFQFHCGRGGYPPFSAKYPTLRGLLSLVTSCPELQVVGLPLDARQVPEIKDAEPCNTDFEWISVPESPIDEALPVAEFLFKYLPGVTNLEVTFSRPPGTNETQVLAYEWAWCQVERHLSEFHGLESGSADGY